MRSDYALVPPLTPTPLPPAREGLNAESGERSEPHRRDGAVITVPYEAHVAKFDSA